MCNIRGIDRTSFQTHERACARATSTAIRRLRDETGGGRAEYLRAGIAEINGAERGVRPRTASTRQ